MIYNDYDSFAYFYNKYWTNGTPLLMEKAIDMLLSDCLADNENIIDLCCGTGNFAGIMKEKGYNVTGVDGSRAMLSYAAINAPECEFICSDIRSFSTEKQFGAALCLFDSINHLTSSDDIVKAFSCVYECLSDNGIFIFDVITDKTVKDIENHSFSAADEKDAIILHCNYDKKMRIIDYCITMFLYEENSWQRSDLIVKEKFYTPQELLSLLHVSGFSNVRISEGYSDLNIECFDDRLFFTAWK